MGTTIQGMVKITKQDYMKSSNKSLNLDAYDNTSAYKAHGHRTETVKPINLCINMYIICSKWN